MAPVPCFLIPVCALAYLPLACSTDGGPNKVLPGPPPAGGSASGGSSTGGSASSGSSTGGASSGATAGGASGSGGMSACGGGGPGSAGPAAACTSTCECPAGGFKCNAATHVCDCDADHPDVCGAGAASVCTAKLTDPDNCGACGMKCDAGAVCVAGKCGTKPTDVVTATGCGGGVRLATDGKNIYWTEVMTGKVRSVPVAGGAISDVATGQLSPTQIGIGSKGVYWVNQGDATAGSSKLMGKIFPSAAGAPIEIKAATGTDKLPAIAVNGLKVYYAFDPATTDVAGIADRGSRVHEATLTAAGDSVMSDVIVGIAVNYDSGKMDISGAPKGIVVTDTAVVWGTPDDRSGVESHSLPAVVTNAADNKIGYGKLGKSVGALLKSGDLGIDSMYGYWADGEKFVRDLLTAQEGMAENVTVAPDAKSITAFSVNLGKMYGSADGGKLFTHSLTPPADPSNDTAPPVLIARDQLNVSSIVHDVTKIYWVTTDCMIRSTGL